MNIKHVKTESNYELIQQTFDYAKEQDLDDEQLLILDRFKHLEQYEQDLLLMRSQGMSLRDIGKELDISYVWVLNHLRDIQKKLNLRQ